MDKLREWVENELDHLEVIRMDVDTDTYVERKHLFRRFLDQINAVDKEGMEDLKKYEPQLKLYEMASKIGSEKHKNYFENMSREDLIEALECGANNITLLHDERDKAQDRCKELETALKDIHKYIDEIIPCIHDEELLDDIIKIVHEVVQIEPENLSEAEHAEIKQKLEEKYLGKRTPDDTVIKSVFVDYRRYEQDMNRVTDEYGNIYFINSLEDK